MRRWSVFPGLAVPLAIGISLVAGLFWLAIADGDRAAVEVKQLQSDITDSIQQMRREASALRASEDRGLLQAAARLESIAGLLDDQTRYLGGLGREAVRVGLTYEPSTTEVVLADAETLAAIARELRADGARASAADVVESAGRVDALASRVRGIGHRLRQLDARLR